MSGQVTPRGRNREGSDEAVELMMGTARSRTVVFADARSAPLVTVLDTPYHIAQLQLQLKALEEEEMRLEAAKKAAKKWKDKSKNSLSSSTSAALHQVDEPSSGRMLRKASSDLDLKVLRGGSSQRLEGFGSERCEVKRTSRQKRIMEARTAVLREPEPETVQRSETSAADRSMKAHQTMGKGWWGRMTAGAKDKEGTFDVDGCF